LAKKISIIMIKTTKILVQIIRLILIKKFKRLKIYLRIYLLFSTEKKLVVLFQIIIKEISFKSFSLIRLITLIQIKLLYKNILNKIKLKVKMKPHQTKTLIILPISVMLVTQILIFLSILNPSKKIIILDLLNLNY
jgi:hypothetical protein